MYLILSVLHSNPPSLHHNAAKISPTDAKPRNCAMRNADPAMRDTDPGPFTVRSDGPNVVPAACTSPAVTPSVGSLLQSQRRISRSFKCKVSGCEVSCKRKSDLKRHEQTVHNPKQLFWCPEQGCTRSNSQDMVSRPFTRKDKRDDHVIKVHTAKSHVESESKFMAIDFIYGDIFESSQFIEFQSEENILSDFGPYLSTGNSGGYYTTPNELQSLSKASGAAHPIQETPTYSDGFSYRASNSETTSGLPGFE